MSPLRLNGSTSGYSQIDAPAVAGDQTFTLPGTGGTLVTTASAGKILQVVQATTATRTIISSTSYTDATNVAATITPTSASSKILVTFNPNLGVERNSNVTIYGAVQIVRASTAIAEYDWIALYTGVSANGYIGAFSQQHFSYLDSPATTSSVTYKMQGKVNSTASAGTIYFNGNPPTSFSTITLLEVAA